MKTPDLSPYLTSIESDYGEPMKELPWPDGGNIFVISDLHIAAGINSNNNYDGSENFFADESFARFMNHLQLKQQKPALLVINGDFVDFIRMGNLPETDNDFIEWENILFSIGISKTVDDLRRSIVKKERKYGLKTNDYKSVWKLHVSANGHKTLFKKLAQWIQQGNYLAITKGNHDLEWYWPAVRKYLCVLLAKNITNEFNKPIEDALQQDIIPHITFADHSLLIGNTFYIEHGHRYQNMTEVKGDAVIAGTDELNLPFGSFFNRYMINRLELAYPFLDNVKPSQNILPILLRDRFPLGIKVLFSYIPFMLLIIPKKIYWETFKYFLSFIWVVVLPIVITGVAVWLSWKNAHLSTNLGSGNKSFIANQLLSILKNFGLLFLSYLFGRILVKVRLKDPPSLYPHAQEVLLQNPSISMVTFGHTHDPEQINDNGMLYFNTGTWTPVFESSSANVRLDKTYTFLHIGYDAAGKIVSQPLKRWNDDALREECLFLNDKK